ncbi:MAG: hypothetical protein ACE5D0_08525 [Fidelibacterota bacterium]
MRILLISLLLLSITLAEGIANDLFVSLNYGSIRTLLNDHFVREEPQFTDYYELEVGREFNSGENYSSLYLAYWDDCLTKPLEIMDAITYSNSSVIIGGRFGMINPLLPKYLNVKANLFFGLAHNFVKGTPIGGLDYGGLPGEKYSRNLNTIEVGLDLTYNIYGPFKILTGIQGIRQISDCDFGFEPTRSAFKIGLVYSR